MGAPSKSRQLTFAERPTRLGKKRLRPGRKAAPGAKVRHRARAVHRRTDPMHITLRAKAGLPSFRRQTLFAAFDEAFRRTRRDDFRIVEFSVQSNHVHMIVEAESNDALARGMKSFTVRANRLFNAAWGRRRGQVWSDRYHRRDLRGPRAVRNALVYCLNNFRKHLRVTSPKPFVDPMSSGPWFEGWVNKLPRDAASRPTPLPETWLLREGWHSLTTFLHAAEHPHRPT